MKKKLLVYVTCIIAVCIGGEFQFYPLDENLRISFGTPVLFFFLLWSRNLNPILTGFLVGISVVLFRSTLLYFDPTYALTWSECILNYLNVSSYYITYGILFHTFRIRNYYKRPVFIALLGIVMEDISFTASVLSRYFYIGELATLETLLTMFFASIYRSFFVLGLFSLVLLKEAQVEKRMYRQKMSENLLFVSNLYVEMVQLKKTMNNTENLTRKSYNLYKNLQMENSNFSKEILYIAGEIHELKKDHQRIYSGLAKLQVKENLDELMDITHIFEIVTEANKRYAQELNKSIEIESTIIGDHPKYNCYMVLSLLNNLICNSIEAIENKGLVLISAEKTGEYTIFKVMDNGPGIAEDLLEIVFEPSYTTKYNQIGVASNGIGLSHIKEVIESLDGEIHLTSDTERRITVFTIKFPVMKSIKVVGDN